MKIISLIICIGVLSGITLSSQCPEDAVFLYSQQDLDQFIADYPDCEYLERPLSVLDSDIVSLEALSGLKETGSLIIARNTNLLSLEGLHNISHCGRLEIDSNELIEDLLGLRSLVYTSGVTVTRNKNLLTFDGLNSVVEAHLFTFIQGNPRLKDVSALGNIEEFQGLWLIGNDSLKRLPNLHNLNSSSQNTTTSIIADNPMLESLEGLDSIKTFSRIDIINNDRLKSLRGLQNATMHRGVWLEISDNDSLLSLDGLQGLDSILESSSISVHGNLYIKNNEQLLSLDGLENLRYVSKDLIIENNPSLSSLSGLKNLDHVGRNLVIANTDLSSLKGLDSLDSESFDLLEISDSPQLSECAIKSVCESIFIGAEVMVDGNALGCNSIQEISDACITSTNATDNSQITIYPNPASDYLILDGLFDNTHDTYIMDQLGNRRLVANNKGEVSISELTSGIYYLITVVNGRRYSLKFVKM